MNTNGNIYTVIYTTVVVVVVAAVLAFVSETLKPKQDANVKADAIGQMLTASKFYEKSELDAMSNDQKIDAYKAVAKSSILVNAEGKECGSLDLSKQEIYTTGQLKAQEKLFEKGSADLKLPVFTLEKDGESVVVIPCYGAGLWGPIWGYIALDSDFQTIRGAYFDHASETPGLGAKIKDDPSFRAEFEGKKIDFSDKEPFSIVKGGAPAGKENAVDAITGASITSQKLGESINNWLKAYKPFLSAAAAQPEQPSEAENAADSLCCATADSLATVK